MDKLFKPEKIAVVGASRHKGKTGHEIFDNLLHDFDGKVVPVNPNAENVEGKKSYDEIPEGTDLAVVVVPSKIVPNVMEDAADKEVDAAIVVSAGFSESGNKQLEDEIVDIAEKNNISLLGPNVLGLINTENSMNASFAAKSPIEGDISFMSQSGAFCTAILDYAKAEHIGFRHFVSLGNKAQLNEVDLLKYWRKDEGTDVILSYSEGINNGREFIEEARKTSREKPIIMVKSGRTNAGGDAASSHTGSMAGSYEAYKAAFRKAGIIEAESNRELLNYGRAFSYQNLPQGKNVAVITNAGGPGVITTDEIKERGLELAEFSEKTKEKLNEKLPDESTPNNPLDVIGDAGHERYRKAMNVIKSDPNVDAIVVVLTPQANTEIKKTAKTIANIEKNTEKTVMTAFIGEKDVNKGKTILENNNIPDFEDPVDAVKTIKAMNKYREYLELEEEDSNEIEYDQNKAKEILQDYEDFEDLYNLFKTYNFDLPLTQVADAPLDAVEAANSIGYPVIMKIDSPDVHHKTDVKGVFKNIENREQVEQKFRDIIDNIYEEKPDAQINGITVQEQIDGLEVALGMKRDPQFGPMIMVGLGGIYIEALEDLSFGIAPITRQEAEKMISQLRSHEIFEGTRNQQNVVEPIKDAIVRLSALSMNNPEIQQIDINPLIVRENAAMVADIEVILDN